MSRYIEADALKASYIVPSTTTNSLCHLYVSVEDIKSAPSIDIVRCKQCRHWCSHKDVDYDQSKFTYYCEVHGISFKGDDYCSFGERKECE